MTMIKRNRGAFSIPMVVLFCSIMVIVLIAFIQTRVNMKQQTKVNFRQLKAHYLAQAGIQHALLKLRILPNESYEAACLERGICPFVPSGTTASAGGTADPRLLVEFCSDVNSTNYPISGSEFLNWKYSCSQPDMPDPLVDNGMKALMAQNSGTERVHAVEIISIGTASTSFKGVMVDTTDIVKRTVKISRLR